ncbi:MAG: TlpA disulfide reductase family protein [Capsulimonas sp.]|uniref:TlpA family protein disulfide reductase n=1 Tax=Capsulimonas sp. TaxID=2494211 RepID=UPI003265ED38
MRTTTLMGRAVLIFGAMALAGAAHAQDAALPAGSKAPAFSTRTVQGAPLSLKSLRGKVVLMDFWATWCGPCRMATPMMQSLHKQFHAKGLKVIGISVDDSSTTNQVKPFMKSFGVTYTMSASPEQNRSMAAKYNAGTIPTVFLIDKKGVIRWSGIGYGEGEKPFLEASIKKLLAEKA